MDDIIVTTSCNVDGYKIVKYLGIKQGIVKINSGIRANSRETLDDITVEAIKEMKQKALMSGANAVIGVEISVFEIQTGYYLESI